MDDRPVMGRTGGADDRPVMGKPDGIVECVVLRWWVGLEFGGEGGVEMLSQGD